MALQLEDVRCDLCGSRDEEFLYTKPGHLTQHPFRLVRCRRCGLLYLNPRLTQDGITKLYDKDYYHGKGFDPLANYMSAAHPMEQEHFTPALLANVLQQRLRPGAKVLDFGCGSGRLAREVQQTGFAVEGFEVSEFAAGYSTALGFNVYTDVDQIPENCFDAVMAVEVLEHCHSPMAALRAIHRALKPGGLFIYTTENFDRFYDRWKKGQTPPQDSYVVPEGHIYFFSTPVMQAYFKAVGYSRVVPFESPAYVKHSNAYKLLQKLHLVEGRKAQPETLWEKAVYFGTRRALNKVGARGFLPLAIK